MRITIAASTKIADTKSCYCFFAYSEKTVNFFRRQSSRYFHAEGLWEKCWEVPQSRLQAVLDYCFENEEDVKLIIPEWFDESAIQIPENFDFKTLPFEHQVEFLRYGLSHDCFICGDEQGLGKTKEVIDLACALKASGKIRRCLIIVCDNNLKWNWVEEISKHSDESGYILGTRYGKKSGKSRIDGVKDRLWDLEHLEDHPEFFLITNIETLRYVEKVPVGKPTKSGRQKTIKLFRVAQKINELTRSGEIGLIAVDEIHLAKNPNSLQGQALLKIDSGRRIPMTGTPVLNSAADTYIPMKFMGLVKENFGGFSWRYGIKDNWGNITGLKNVDELHGILSGHMIRRLKSDVFDLPPKVYTNIYVDLLPEQQKIYDEVLEEIRKNIDLVRLSNNPLAQLIRLRQATGWTGILSSTIQCSAKFDATLRLVESAVSSGSKCVLFSNWTNVTQPLRQMLQQYQPAYITGEVADEARQGEVHRFQEDPNCKVIIGSVAAMGRGRTLTAGTNVIFLDEPWNMGTKEQCCDRAHRIGTTGTVNIYTIIAKNTIDERINQIVQSKGDLADMIVDGKATQKQRAELVDFLLS